MTKTADTKLLNETEARILKAAEHEFMTKGFAGARTTSIAEAAGVTHAMFHYYFRTKEKLFDRIISEKMEMFREMILKSFGDINLPLDSLIRNLINSHLDFVSSNPELPRFLIFEILNDPDRLSFFSEKIKRVALDIIVKLQMKIDELSAIGKCRKIDAKMLMLDVISLNLFPFIANPLVNSVLDNCMADSAVFLENRKKENFDTIIRKLKL